MVILGFLVGFLLCHEGRVVCALVGTAAGTVNTFIVMLLKKYLKKKVIE